MDKEKAKKILYDIQNECAKRESCGKCPFCTGLDVYEYNCIFDDKSNITPAKWNGIDTMPNL